MNGAAPGPRADVVSAWGARCPVTSGRASMLAELVTPARPRASGLTARSATVPLPQYITSSLVLFVCLWLLRGPFAFLAAPIVSRPPGGHAVFRPLEAPFRRPVISSHGENTQSPLAPPAHQNVGLPLRGLLAAERWLVLSVSASGGHFRLRLLASRTAVLTSVVSLSHEQDATSSAAPAQHRAERLGCEGRPQQSRTGRRCPLVGRRRLPLTANHGPSSRYAPVMQRACNPV